MDLNKHAFRLSPLIPSELIADAFALAWDIRILDMRAAPYDFSGVVLNPDNEWTPVAIATPEGKTQYVDVRRRGRGAPQPPLPRAPDARAEVGMSSHRLRVDWPECQGRGICHELAPEVVQLDPWGYPIITGPVDEATLAVARDAVSGCPRRAIRLEKT